MRTRGWDPLLQMRINDEVFKLIAAVLENASTDWDLTNFLRERAIQYRDDMEPSLEWRIIAQASVKYIQRCGISFLEHTHQPDMNKCAICDLCHNAVVVEEEIPDILMEPPPRLPSIEDIDDFLAAVGMVDGVPAYPFTHKLDISVAPDGAIVTSFVGEPPFSYKYLT
ncbi:hypothetical protein BJ912DRAFT_469130 [Pholiota molesta]|nr:hypothetical protein BJ912DRAFT_469130 [Pholiota molesta]